MQTIHRAKTTCGYITRRERTMILHTYDELDTYLGEKVLLVCDSTIKFLKINEYFNGKGNIIKQPCFTEIRGTDAYRVVGNLENSDFVVNNTFWVGVYPGMTDTMIDYMAQVIKEAVNK